MTGGVPAISFHDVTLGYDRHPAVHHITGEVKSGALLAVIGPNGAGKSTLLKGIAGELRPLGGSITLNGVKSFGDRLPAAADRDRSPVSHLGVRLRCHGAVAQDRRLWRC